jgi:two-component system, chemotaxis family, CheB/CheR fusion protein
MTDVTNDGDTIGEKNPADFVIAGLGGSAGSIPSFREFFRNVPPDSGMAYVVILHLSPEHDSHLAEVLQKSASIPVMQVQTPVKVAPDHVYVIPPNKSLAMNDGTLVVSEMTGFEERRAPVDIFFRTLADTHESRAVCVIFSGSGADGSMGLRRIKENNGLVLVQDPAEAEFDEMPLSSIATGLVDYILPVAEMPGRMMAYRQQLRSPPLLVKPHSEDDEQALMEIFTLLRIRTGHDFTNYKRATVLRRIERRMAVREIARLPEYARFLRDDSTEADALLRSLLISVTNFFRDRQVWETLEETIIPKLFDEKGADDHLRVWVAGCATGEEAYSLAMVLADGAAKLQSPAQIQLFATDLDAEAIAKARNGYYSVAESADVPPDRLRRYFLKERDGYRVRRELRELVLFAHHNLIKDPPFSHLDFVSCRNVLIYLNRTVQARTMELLHFALEPGGFVLLGTAESVDGSGQLFSTVDKEHHIYQSRAVPRVVTMLAPAQLTATADLRHTVSTAERTETRPRFAPLELHQRLLEDYAAPSLIVDEQYDIVHLTERAGKYLQFAVGDASLNLLQVVRPELRVKLRAALSQSSRNRGTVAVRGVSVNIGPRDETIDVIVRPTLRDGDPARGYFLVLFESPRDSVLDEPREATAVEPAARQMEEELIRVKARMRDTIEQYEMQVEEARAANEELQAMNEELRSTAEELETSQEELQSVNEELQTVNQELKVKIDEVSHANNDMRNLMSSTEIGTIFVDRSLCVKLFTPRIRDIFNLIPADVGRSLLDITSKLTIDKLATDVEAVLDRLQTIEREVQTRNGSWHLMRLLPYRTAEDRIDGVVLTFVDISKRKQAETALRESEERHRAIVTSARDYAIVTADIDGMILSWSPGAEAVFGWSEAEALGRPLGMTFTPEDQAAAQPEKERQLARDEGSAPDVRWHIRKDKSRIFVDGMMRLLTDAEGAPRGFLKIGIDMTQRRTTEEALRNSEARLRAVANIGPDLMWSNDANGVTDWYNQRWLEYTGQTFEEARGYGWLEAIHPDDRAQSMERFRVAFRSGERLRHEHRIRNSDNEYRWFLVQAEPLREADGTIVRWFGAATDIHEQRIARDLLEERVRERTHQLEDLSAQRQQLLERLVTATEEERQRVARELHDELGQHIAALRVELAGKQEKLSPRLGEIAERLDETIDRLMLELRPPILDHLGLHGAITSLAQDFSAASGLGIDVHLPGVGEGVRFSEAIETALYRAVQEGLTNAWKHARASTVSVIVERDQDTLRMILEDNGRGFESEGALAGEPARGRFGLLGMRERLALVRGTVDIESQPGSGTAIYIRVPLPDAKSG